MAPERRWATPTAAARSSSPCGSSGARSRESFGGLIRFWQAVSFLEAEQLLDVARSAEAVGFDGAFVSDHVFFPGELVSKYPYNPDGVPYFDKDTPWLETFASIGAMAAVTKRLRFVT